MNAYITKLDNEICDDIPAFAEHKPLLREIFDATRIFGYCGVQPYSDESFKVFTPMQRSDWLTEVDPVTKKKIRVGMKVKWTDDLGNNFEDKLYFDDRKNENEQIVGKCYLFIWENGNGQILTNAPADSAFAVADLNTSVLSIAIQSRQIQDALTFSATNPFFYHLVYGDGITPAQRQALINQMSFVNSSKAIGAKESILKEVRVIENGATEKSILALDQMIAFFAANTRLPLSFYLGEKQTGGLGDTGESTDEVKLCNKKQFILQHFLDQLTELFQDQFGESLGDLSQFYTQKLEADQAKRDAIVTQSQSKQVGATN